jgi:chromosome segregation ATPase
MSTKLKVVLGLIEQLESTFDDYLQSFKKNTDEILNNIGNSWKNLKLEQEEIKKIDENIEKQNSELTELKIILEEIDKKVEGLKVDKEELTSKITELTNTRNSLQSDLEGPKMEINDITSKLYSINDKISVKESEKNALEQKKIDNENRESQLKTLYTEEKMQDLNFKLAQLKRNNFFASFLMENSEEKIPEVDIIATIMTQGSCNLDELKKLLDVPPIMAVRTIKQLAVKGIINLDETTNIITLP